MLAHSAASTLIREKCQRALQRLGEFKPYQIHEPVEIKVEYTPVSTRERSPQEGVERVNDRTWIVREKTFLDAWYKL
jgi:D-aminopeptidase